MSRSSRPGDAASSTDSSPCPPTPVAAASFRPSPRPSRRRRLPAAPHNNATLSEMSEDPRDAIIREFWKNEIREEADDLDRMMIELIEEEEHRREAAQSTLRRKNRRRYVDRGREEGHDRLVSDYFSDDPTFKAETFRRRFRMRRELFLRIVDAVQNQSNYFKWREDAIKRKGLSPLQKCTAAIRQLAYVSPIDSLDKYIQMGERTALDCLFNFCQCVVDVFGAQYLRSPNVADTQRLIQMHEQRHGFRGMLGSLDCIHWEWRNCPAAWKCMYIGGDYEVPTINLEVVASADLWIWYTFFGVARSSTGINVLHGSPLFNAVLQGNAHAPEVNFTVNGTSYTKGYYLTDGIYPEWSSFVKSFPCPMDPRQKKFKERQEAARKDVERAFGVLQARWAIVRGPTRSYCDNELRNIMYTCIILHNMIIENEGDEAVIWFDEDSPPPTTSNMGFAEQIQIYLQNHTEVRNGDTHHQLQHDLVEHIWEQFKCN